MLYGTAFLVKCFYFVYTRLFLFTSFCPYLSLFVSEILWLPYQASFFVNDSFIFNYAVYAISILICGSSTENSCLNIVFSSFWCWQRGRRKADVREGNLLVQPCTNSGGVFHSPMLNHHTSCKNLPSSKRGSLWATLYFG